MNTSIKQPTILVIEDDVEVTDLLETVFLIKNCNFLSASDGKDGIEKAKINKPDLVFLDINLPEVRDAVEIHTMDKQADTQGPGQGQMVGIIRGDAP